METSAREMVNIEETFARTSLHGSWHGEEMRLTCRSQSLFEE